MAGACGRRRDEKTGLRSSHETRVQTLPVLLCLLQQDWSAEVLAVEACEERKSWGDAMSANDAVCYSCGMTLGEHRVGDLACQCGTVGQPLFGPTRFQPLPDSVPVPEPTGGEWFRFLHPGERDEWEPEEDER